MPQEAPLPTTAAIAPSSPPQPSPRPRFGRWALPMLALVAGVAVGTALVPIAQRAMKRDAEGVLVRVGTARLTERDLATADRARLYELRLEEFGTRYRAAERAVEERVLSMAAADAHLDPAEYPRREIARRAGAPSPEDVRRALSSRPPVNPTLASLIRPASFPAQAVGALAKPSAESDASAAAGASEASLRRTLQHERDQAARRALLTELRDRFGVELHVARPAVDRVRVDPASGVIVRAGSAADAEPVWVVVDPTTAAGRSLVRSVESQLHDRTPAIGLAVAYVGARELPKALVCADAQGRAPALHAALFQRDERQAPAGLSALAEAAGLAAPEFEACMTADSTAARVRAMDAARTAAGVGSDPAVVVDGVRLPLRQAELLTPLLDLRARSRAG